MYIRQPVLVTAIKYICFDSEVEKAEIETRLVVRGSKRGDAALIIWAWLAAEVYV